MIFSKLIILESSLLESPNWGNDVTYHARQIKAYIDTFLTISTNGFFMRFCYKNPNSISKCSQMGNIRNLEWGQLKGRMIIKQSRTESKKGSSMKDNMNP